MDEEKTSPQAAPVPPASAPPMPPTQEMLRPVPAHVPLTPMMDFFQRRLEGLERELSVERERARSATGMLQQQESLRSEVESQLKSLSEQLRREKNERESEEDKARSRGRVDALEKRLDEMHQSWASLLKDAVGQRQTGERADGAAFTDLKAEVSALAAALKDLSARMSQVPDALPELRSLAGQLAADARRAEEQLGGRLSDIAGRLREELSQWQRRQELESEKARERLEALARERADITAALDEHNHQLRQEFLKERIQREGHLDSRIAEGLRGLEEVKVRFAPLEGGWAELKGSLEKLAARLSAPATAKDQAVADLEAERTELIKMAQARAEALRRHLEERRQVETSLGESLLDARRELDETQKSALASVSRASALEAENAALRDKLALSEKTVREREDRALAMSAERDKLAKILVSEAGKVREQVEDRLALESGVKTRLEDIQKRLAAESMARTQSAMEASELRAKVAGLNEQVVKILQEKEETLAHYAQWETERGRLMASLKEKDDVISMLNATFQGLLKKD